MRRHTRCKAFRRAYRRVGLQRKLEGAKLILN